MQRARRRQPQEFDRVLSSMCTEPHPRAHEAAVEFLATNPGDPATYQTVADLETEAVEQLGEIAGLDDAYGYIASGGTEANIQAVHAARNRADGSVGSDHAEGANIVAPESVHFSVTKAAEMLGVDLRTVPVDDDYRADLDAVEAAVDDDTALVIGVAGSTEYGRVDPIPAMADLAHDADARMHVDASWGGFILPFTDYEWSFADAPIDSMAIDPHKFGQAPVPAGGLLARERETVDALAVETPYLETTSQATLTGTRSGAGVAGAVAAMDELWPAGYRQQYREQQTNAEFLADELADRGIDVVEPTLPLVTASLSPATFDALRDEEWRIARTADGDLRIVCMPHVSRASLEAFLADLDRVRS
ncbi:tyrosine decarboxylase MfnA [Halonotius terrestris]|uniref:Probable L-aspartate decarboxylase n=1 Tax=Halonotius terrestris TaxID=2487750 RepID=A0A8J8PDU1_9EURY|nr:tyrosine decarboxylase MfnA [Halonotius terrestris]TQQ83541.1 tyrosine decarboxylase MfnA [Halonotius terrestris]